jgi:hypothetical protein
MKEIIIFSLFIIWHPYSYETVALRKILLTDRRATIRSESVLKVAYFLRMVWDIFLHSHTQSGPKQGIKNSYDIYLLLSYHHYLTKFDFPLLCDQTLRSRVREMIGEKFKCGIFKAALDNMSDICKFSDDTRLVVKCLKYILIPCFGVGCVWG